MSAHSAEIYSNDLWNTEPDKRTDGLFLTSYFKVRAFRLDYQANKNQELDEYELVCY